MDSIYYCIIVCYLFLFCFLFWNVVWLSLLWLVALLGWSGHLYGVVLWWGVWVPLVDEEASSSQYLSALFPPWRTEGATCAALTFLGLDWAVRAHALLQGEPTPDMTSGSRVRLGHFRQDRVLRWRPHYKRDAYSVGRKARCRYQDEWLS